MLVFSRKENESFVIGDGPTKVVLTVVQIERGKVRIGIQADKSIPIFRQELVDGSRERPSPAQTAAKVNVDSGVSS